MRFGGQADSAEYLDRFRSIDAGLAEGLFSPSHERFSGSCVSWAACASDDNREIIGIGKCLQNAFSNPDAGCLSHVRSGLRQHHTESFRIEARA